MFRCLKRWLKGNDGSGRSGHHRTTLGLQRLEAREVPAAFHWAPASETNLLATTASN